MRHKGLMKIAALFLAAAMLLTGCASAGTPQNGESGKSGAADAADTKKAEKSKSIVSVSDEKYTLDGKEGLYTGEWCDGVPEGSGEFVIDDLNHYKGEWKSGMLFGEGEFAEHYDDGSSVYYEGKCADNLPVGEGYMVFHAAHSPYFMVIKGNFADESTLTCHITDFNKKLFDFGGIVNGEFVSYVNNPDIEGISIVRKLNNNGYITEAYKPGVYIGEVDENNVPNGYGYFEEYWQEPNGSYVHSQILGSWKEGYLEGYYTQLFQRSKTPDDFTFGVKSVGCMTDGKNVGDYEDYFFNKDGSITVERVNYDTYDNRDNFELGEDGICRGSYKTSEYFNADGTYGYSKRRIAYKLNEDGSYGNLYVNIDGRDCINNCEGEYCNYDSKGNVTDYGIPLSDGWLSQKPNEISLEAILMTAGVALLGAYVTYKFIIVPSNQEIEEMSAAFKERENLTNLKRELEDRAVREAKAGHKEYAEDLLEEADNITLPNVPHVPW